MRGRNSCLSYTAVLLLAILTSHSDCAGLTTAYPFVKYTYDTKPGNVTEFTCISYDYEYMECSFTIPENMVLTNYDLEYRLPADNSVHKCFCRDIKKDKLLCNVTDYLPMRETYLFSVRGKNDVGENIQEFPIENHNIVLPSSIDIIKRNITSCSISLSLQKLKISYYAKIGLTYDIQIRDKSSDWRIPNMGELDCQKGICNIIVTDLYVFWLYWIKVRVKSSGVQSDNYWSPEAVISFRTKPERPKNAPETPIGGFFIDSTETLLRLYWEQTPEHEQNGPGFHYVINEVGVDTLSIKTNESSATFIWKNVSMQIFRIKSGNDIGESIDHNFIHVYRSGSSHNELNEKSITKVYHNSSYTLSWLPPENMKDLMNYTVFWCLPRIELPSQCKGPISYEYLDKFATNFTTKPKDRSLNLAISANYQNYNRGMQWARCSGDISTELMKMELEVNAVNKSSILVKWNSGSVCESILKGYNLTFCQASSDDKCISPASTIEFLRDKREYRNYTLSDIRPYTNVCLYMFMYSSTKQGRISDLYCTRTKASAPSPPKNIEYLKNTLTSKSAQIQWSPPDVMNGVLSHYTVYWRRYPDQTFEKNTTSADQTSYNLTGLNSYSNYEIYVTANTTEESIPSAYIKFTTLIGIPSGPRNLNIYENDTIIYWEQPDLPSGSHLFYVVALIRWDEKFNPIYERLSIVRGRSCRFQHPDCLNSNESYTLTVRAVNVGGEEEVDGDILSMDKDAILSSALVDEHFCEADKLENFIDINIDSIFQNDKNVFFASPWSVAARSYSCSASSKASLYAVALTVVIAFTFYICCWLRNKYYKMKNIKVILPEGLVEQVSSYKFAKTTSASGSNLVPSGKNDIKPDISRSSDCLVAYGHKKHINLITNFNKAPANAFLCFSSANSAKEHYGDEHTEEHHSLETTNVELSSNCSSASKSNTEGHYNRQIESLSSIESSTISATCCEEIKKKYGHVIKELCQDEKSTNTNEYVVHNLQFLASMVNASGRGIHITPHFSKALPSMSSDGYMQPGAAK